jgi:predicted esterase
MHKHITIPLRTSYCTLNQLTDKTETIWFVCHGQGQLAEYFIKKFEGLDPVKNFIIAPQGISKYYLNGFTGRVGASWMTKEDRLTEIDNQQTLLRAIWEQEVGEVRGKRIIFFGFSQGVATISRFAAFSKLPFDILVLWAGGFPPDIPLGSFNHLKGHETVRYFTGHDDPYYKPEMLHTQTSLVLEAVGRAPITTFFDGGHTVLPALLSSI